MATFSINDTLRRVTATGNGSNRNYTFNFQVNVISDIKVYVDGTLRNQGTGSSDYAVDDGSGNAGLSATGTGRAVFVTAPTNNAIITILSDVPLARTSLYTNSGNVTATALENDFDTLTMGLADREERTFRSIKAPVQDPTDINMDLPAKADRLGKILGFNETTGNPEISASLTAVQSLSAVTASINLLGTSAVVEDMGLLSASINMTAMGLLGTSSVISTMSSLGNSSVLADMSSLGTSTVIANIASVAGKTTEIGLLGTSSNIANMGTLTASGVIANIATVASRDTAIGVVSSADTNIATVAGQISPTNNIATVAGKAPLITSDFISDLNLINSTFVSQMNLVTSDFVSDLNNVTADFIADLNQLATSDFIADLNSLASADFVSDLNQVEQIKADVSVVASNVTGVNSFAERYRVGSSDPTSSNDEGDLFYNSTSNTVRFYNGSAWVAITATTINNNADNRIITGSGTSNTLEGEANLTYDGTSLLVGNDGVIKFDATDSNVASNVIIGQPRPANMTAGVNRSTTIIGKNNLNAYTTGTQNIVMGHGNAISLTTGSNNFIIGYENMRGTTGVDTNNVMIGYHNFREASYRSLSNVLIGSYNNFGSSDDNDYPENNVGIGRSNLYNNQENYNVAIGFANIQNNDYNNTGYNVGIGYECLKNVHRSTRNVAIGYQANHSTSGTSTNNVNNVSIGYNAMRFGEGSSHVAIGRDALENSHSSSQSNVAIGDSAMENSTSSSSSYNVVIGHASGSNIGGMYNNLIGYSCGSLLGSVYFNNYTGMYSGYSSNSGITLDLRSSSSMVVQSSLASYIHHASGIQTANFGNPSERFPNFSHFTASNSYFTGVTHLTYNASGEDHYRFFNANGDVGSISTSGTSTVYSTSSDHRLKENVNYTFDATTRLKQLKPARFNFIADGSDNTVDGFLAHEVMSIVPEAVIGTHNGTKEEEYVKTPAVYKDVVKPEEVDEDGNVLKEEKTFQELVTEQVKATRTVPDYQKIDQAKLVPLLTKTILELEARITALENA
tara:strand:- start:349 stop:3417 length:3069 start_codon:yes stop_codon:yes gene_type:complete